MTEIKAKAKAGGKSKTAAAKAQKAQKAAKKEPVLPKKTGRPSEYNDQIARRICLMIAEGMSLRKICAMNGMPHKSTVFNWLARYPEFFDQYARARELGSEVWAEEMIDIADDGTNDWLEKTDKDGKVIGMVIDHEHVQRSKLRIDTRKWLLAKLRPKKYGERIDLNHGGQATNPIRTLIDQVSGTALRPSSDETEGE